MGALARFQATNAPIRQVGPAARLHARTAPAPSQQARARFRARLQARYARQQGNSAPRPQPNVVNSNPFWRGDTCILRPADQLRTWEAASRFVGQLRDKIQAVYHAQYPLLKTNAFRTMDLSCFAGSKIGLPKWTRETQNLWTGRLTNCNYSVRGGAVGLFPMLHGTKSKTGCELILKDTQFLYGIGGVYGYGIYGQFMNNQLHGDLARFVSSLRQYALGPDRKLRVINAVSLPRSIKLISQITETSQLRNNWVRAVNANGTATFEQVSPDRKYCDASFPLMLWETASGRNCLAGANKLQDFPWHKRGLFTTCSFTGTRRRTRAEIERSPWYQTCQENKRLKRECAAFLTRQS